jgi:hypothetical protein
MKNKALWISLAVLTGLVITFVGCSGDGFDGAYDKPSAVGSIEAKTYPGATILTWGRVYNVTNIDIYRTSTAAGSPTIFLGTVDGNVVTYVDKLSGTAADIVKNWTPGGSYVYTFVARNYTGGTVSTTKSGTITMNSAILGSNITDWVRSNTQVSHGTPFKAVWVSTTDNNPDRVAVTIRNVHPDITYTITVKQKATAFDTSLNNPTTDGTTLGTATVNFGSTTNIELDETVLITLSGWVQGQNRQIIVQFGTHPLFQITQSHTTGGAYPIYLPPVPLN